MQGCGKVYDEAAERSYCKYQQYCRNFRQCRTSQLCGQQGGVIGLTKSLAKEFSAWGIRVNSVAPGFVETDMTGVLSEKLRESMLSSVPLKRPGQPEDIAGAVLFLAGQSASYITGQVLTVDGGMSL